MMKLFLLLLLPLSASAELVVFEIQGRQYAHELGKGGSVTKDAQILCDERKGENCNLSKTELGALSRSSGFLVVDTQKKVAKLAKEAAEIEKARQRSQAESDLAALEAKIESEIATVEEVRKAYKLQLVIKKLK